MKNSNTLKLVAAGLSIACSSAVFAHAGHGMNGPHWHATDTWGFMLVIAVAAWIIAGRPGGRK